jgi:hypothetical protein
MEVSMKISNLLSFIAYCALNLVKYQPSVRAESSHVER